MKASQVQFGPNPTGNRLTKTKPVRGLAFLGHLLQQTMNQLRQTLRKTQNSAAQQNGTNMPARPSMVVKPQTEMVRQKTDHSATAGQVGNESEKMAAVVAINSDINAGLIQVQTIRQADKIQLKISLTEPGQTSDQQELADERLVRPGVKSATAADDPVTTGLANIGKKQSQPVKTGSLAQAGPMILARPEPQLAAIPAAADNGTPVRQTEFQKGETVTYSLAQKPGPDLKAKAETNPVNPLKSAESVSNKVTALPPERVRLISETIVKTTVALLQPKAGRTTEINARPQAVHPETLKPETASAFRQQVTQSISNPVKPEQTVKAAVLEIELPAGFPETEVKPLKVRLEQLLQESGLKTDHSPKITVVRAVENVNIRTEQPEVQNRLPRTNPPEAPRLGNVIKIPVSTVVREPVTAGAIKTFSPDSNKSNAQPETKPVPEMIAAKAPLNGKTQPVRPVNADQQPLRATATQPEMPYRVAEPLPAATVSKIANAEPVVEKPLPQAEKPVAVRRLISGLNAAVRKMLIGQPLPAEESNNSQHIAKKDVTASSRAQTPPVLPGKAALNKQPKSSEPVSPTGQDQNFRPVLIERTVAAAAWRAAEVPVAKASGIKKINSVVTESGPAEQHHTSVVEKSATQAVSPAAAQKTAPQQFAEKIITVQPSQAVKAAQPTVSEAAQKAENPPPATAARLVAESTYSEITPLQQTMKMVMPAPFIQAGTAQPASGLPGQTPLLEQLLQVIRVDYNTGRERESRASFTIDGGELGEIEMNFQEKGHDRHLSIVVDTAAAQKEIQKWLPHIQQQLVEKGIEFQGMNVRQNEQDTRQNQPGNGSGSQHQSSTNKEEQNHEAVRTTPVSHRRYGYNTMEIIA